jgi:hypothetical protein
VSGDRRDILEVLKLELQFLENGGYLQSLHNHWKAPSLFLDSHACVNYGLSHRPHPCGNCCLTDFVPAEAMDENIPCHFIRLNPQGDTINSLERHALQTEIETAVKQWLAATIAGLEKEEKNAQAPSRTSDRRAVPPAPLS